MRAEKRVFAAVLVVLSATGCGRAGSGHPIAAPRGQGKVLVVGIPGVAWGDIARGRPPNILDLIDGGAVAAVSVRVSNRPAEAYLALGAGSRADSGIEGGWAFNRSEHLGSGDASELAERMSGPTGGGGVVVAAIREITDSNRSSGSFRATPGLLAARLEKTGRLTAVVGSADHFTGPLPADLPAPASLEDEETLDPGIHREAALAAMNPSGSVAYGDVSRSLLMSDARTAFGIRTSRSRLLEEFRRVWPRAGLVVVETGDTARADDYLSGLGETNRRNPLRLRGLALADRQVGELVAAAGKGTLVVLLAPTTPGGPEVRGGLRPAVIAGAGVPRGIATSPSTRRRGVITIADVTATIARHLGIAGDVFAAGKAVRILDEGAPRITVMTKIDESASIHDRLRAPVQIAGIAVGILVYALAIARLRRARLPAVLTLLLLASLALPLASYVSHFLWTFGAPAAAAGVAVTAGAAAALALVIFGGREAPAAAGILGATMIFLASDLASGGGFQLDSVYGYTSVAGGRFFGFGNLAFALFAACSLLLAGMSADRGARWKFAAPGIVAGSILIVGHPGLGADVGGTLTLAVVGTLLAGRILLPGALQGWRLVLPAAIAVIAVGVFGLIDLMRPPFERTHLGEFVAGLLRDPLLAWGIITRKGMVALQLAVSTKWGAVIPMAVAVIVWLYRRRDRWHDLLGDKPATREGFRAVLLAAVIGSLVNDTGVAVGGVMLMITIPWALLVASSKVTAA